MQAGHKSVITPGQVSGAGARPALSEIERGILDFIVLFLRSNTYQPSIREIGRHFGIKSTKTVSEHLQALADKGYIDRDPSRSRGVRIFGVDLNAESVSLPLFDDLQAAMPGGRSRPATHITLDRQLAGGSGGFIVRAPTRLVGGSQVAEGDLLVIAPVTADELAGGELIVARVGGTADYFRVKREKSEILLQPVLGEGVPARMGEPASLVLVGRVAGLYRRVGPEAFTEPATAH
jgi:repressor LexA